MITPRIGILVIGSVLLGFASGWYLHSPRSNATVVSTSRPPAPPMPAVRAVQTYVAETPTSTPIAAPTRLAAPSLSEHLAIMRWLKQNGLLSYVGFFDGKNVDQQFASVYGLTPAETADLSEASRQAKEQLAEMTLRHVELDPTSDEKKLIVTVPAFAKEGGQVYDALLGKISSVLGPDRYALFDEISGRALDQEFGGFGLARNRYEVVLQATPGGDPVFKATRAYVYDAIDYRPLNGIASGSTSGTSSGGFVNNSMNASGIIESFPFLKSFTLPSVPSATVAK